jgi:hypothetical protein
VRCNGVGTVSGERDESAPEFGGVVAADVVRNGRDLRERWLAAVGALHERTVSRRASRRLFPFAHERATADNTGNHLQKAFE